MNRTTIAPSFEPGEDCARALDAADDLAPLRERFWLPEGRSGDASIYLCGHSLGLQPKDAAPVVTAEMDRWRRRAVDGHFDGDVPWFSYHEALREPLAEIVGARPAEVVAMNSLTVNLHLMLVSFYRPRRDRYRIVIDKHAFPSDRYAVASQLRYHGHDPAEALVELEDAPGSALLSEATLADYLDRHGASVALVLLPGVQYFSGELEDIAALTALAHRHGCVVGVDLAHAAGNVPLALHDWGCDFAVWCSYKYLNGGPGAVGGAFVHERNFDARPRFEGWWGNDPATRFRMAEAFDPAPGADAWQLSNLPILSAAPVRVALDLFREARITRLREKSIVLTGYLEYLLQDLAGELTVLTPSEPERRGCQLSLRIGGPPGRGRQVFQALIGADVICDWRAPDVIRVAPVPLYNQFVEVYYGVQRLTRILRQDLPTN